MSAAFDASDFDRAGDEVAAGSANDVEARELPPHDIEAEAAVLSAVMVDPEAFARVRRTLRPEHFYVEAHQRVFEACAALDADGKPIDVVMVATWLRDRDRLAQVGGMAFLTEVLNASPAVGNVSAHADAVFEYSRKRLRVEAARRVEALTQAGRDASDAAANLVALCAPRLPRWSAQVVTVPPEWLEQHPPARTWLLRDARHPKARGVFPLGKVGQLIAEGGAGKTLALCQLAVATATGGRWLGAFDVVSPGPVLLALGEEDAEEARRRIYHAVRVGQGRSPEPGALEVLPLAGEVCAMLARDNDGNAAETDFVRWLRDYVRARNFRLVVVDPLSRFAGPDAEKDNAVATRFMQALESLAAPDRAVLNAHHVNKLSRGPMGTVDGSSGRGSSAFVDGARWQGALSVERPKLDGAEERARLGELVRFSVTKSNYAAKPEAILLRHDLDHGGALVPLDEEDLAIVEGARVAMAPRAARLAEETLARQRRESEAATKVAERAAAKLADEQADVAVATALLAEMPDATARELRIAMKARAHCGTTRADLALFRARSAKGATT